MVEKKRKTRDEPKTMRTKKKSNVKSGRDRTKNKTGPRLPNSLRKELDRAEFNPNSPLNSEDEEIDSDEGNYVYEYEEKLPEEETRKNHRFDPVENYEYELPAKFKDENVLSDDDNDEFFGGHEEGDNKSRGAEEEDDEKHMRMLEGITGMPSEVFGGKKMKRNNVVMSEPYPESEYNPTRDILDGHNSITIQDLLEPLQGKTGFSKLRKRMEQFEKNSMPIHAPLPKPDREKLERKAVKEQMTKELNKWGPSVKRNREAPTIFFDEDVDLGFSTVGAIASEFEARTEFEKKMASLVYDQKVMEAHKEDGARLLELNEVSVEDHVKYRDHIAKMRSLLFRHELKSKRIKKIKSKTYHRLRNKDRRKAESVEMLMDPEATKEQLMKQEFKRAEERMTLRHKNKSKWAKHVLKLGLNARDEGTRAAITEQLHLHATLTRKMNTMKEGSSSSDDSSDEDDVDGDPSSLDQNASSNLLAKAKEKTLKVLEEDDEVPNSGLLSLPFMVRGSKKRNEAALEEAKLALREYEELEGKDNMADSNVGTVSGRRVFGTTRKEVAKPNHKMRTDKFYGTSDSEDDQEAREDSDVGNGKNNNFEKGVGDISDLPNEGTDFHQDSVLENYDDIVGNPGVKTTYDVAIFASGTWKKMKDGSQVGTNVKDPLKVGEPALPNRDLVEAGEENDSDSEGQMVDGMLSSSQEASYELPSQAELIHHAFAGDDVEEEFEKDKQEILNEEVPEPEKPVLLPGWGQWTNIQQKKGLPSWMLKEHDDARRKREQTLKNRKDAHLKHVVITEKMDKKAEKLHTKTLPYPFTSKEAFEQSIRMPIGPEFNPATAIGALNQPEVVKKRGLIIKPIKFEELNPHEKGEDHMRNRPKPKQKVNKDKVNGSQNHTKKKATGRAI